MLGGQRAAFMSRFSHDVGSWNQILVIRLWEEHLLTGLVYYLFFPFFLEARGEDYVAQDGFKILIPGPK